MAAAPFRRDFYTQKYFPSLDGLRALSIVPVVWHHSTPHTFEGVLGRGAVGVDLFFAISGFLITTLLVRERRERKRIDLFAFYVRRSLRIFPLYFFVLGLNLLYALWVRPNWDPSRNFLERLPYYATYSANWLKGTTLAGPSLFVFAWSLCTEEQFYAFWAPLLRATRRLVHAAAVMTGIVVLDLFVEAFPASELPMVPEGVRIVLTSFATPIGFGALLSLAVHHPRWGEKIVRFASLPLLSPLVLATTVSAIVFDWTKLWVLHALLALLVLVCSAQPRHGLSRFLDHPVIAYVGRVSYGIYMWHVAVIGGVKALCPSLVNQPVWLFALSMPLSVVVAAISYQYFEQPLLRLGKGFRRLELVGNGSPMRIRGSQS